MVDFFYIGGDPEDPSFSDREEVSDLGNHSSDEYPWECGPCSAMRGGDITVCAWTRRQEWEELVFYDILGDQDL